MPASTPPLAAPPVGGALGPVSRWGRGGACALNGLRPHFLVAAGGAAAALLRGSWDSARRPRPSLVTWGRAQQVSRRRLVGRSALGTPSASRELPHLG